MPLYDYRCRTCDELSTQLVKSADATVACPACGSLNVERELAPFAIGGKPAPASTREATPSTPTPGQRAFERHVCTSGCQHGKADALVKKYLG